MRLGGDIGADGDVALLCLLLFGEARFVAEVRQNVLQHGADNRGRDGRGLRVADNRLIQRDQNGDLRVIRRGKAQEGEHVAVLVSVFVEVIQLFGGTGLAADAVARDGGVSSGCVRTTRDNLLAHIADLGGGLLRNDLAANGWLGSLDDIVVRIDDLFDDVRLHQVAAVERRGQRRDQLDTRDLEGLAERAGAQFRDAHIVQCVVHSFIIRFTRQVNAGQVAQTKAVKVGGKVFRTSLLADFDKGRVTGVLDGIRQSL